MLAMSACPLASATTLSRWADVKVTRPGHSLPGATVIASRLNHPDKLSALLATAWVSAGTNSSRRRWWGLSSTLR